MSLTGSGIGIDMANTH